MKQHNLTRGFLGGVLTVAIPIAFTIYLADDSNRPGMDFEEAARGSLPPLALLSAVVANLFGVDGPMKDFWGPPASSVWGETDLALAGNMGAIYFGAIPLAALACAAGVLGDRAVRIFLVMMVFMLLYTVGRSPRFSSWPSGFPALSSTVGPPTPPFPWERCWRFWRVMGSMGSSPAASGCA